MDVHIPAWCTGPLAIYGAATLLNCLFYWRTPEQWVDVCATYPRFAWWLKQSRRFGCHPRPIVLELFRAMKAAAATLTLKSTQEGSYGAPYQPGAAPIAVELSSPSPAPAGLVTLPIDTSGSVSIVITDSKEIDHGRIA
jgi:hypothetical protein